jgi:hypothetical protein
MCTLISEHIGKAIFYMIQTLLRITAQPQGTADLLGSVPLTPLLYSVHQMFKQQSQYIPTNMLSDAITTKWQHSTTCFEASKQRHAKGVDNVGPGG